MKIVDWDNETMSLIVKFTSDINETSIDDATPLSYQPFDMFPDVKSVDELVKRVAVSGIHLCEQLANREKNQKDLEKIANMQNLKDKTFQFTVDELINMDKIEDELEQTDSQLKIEDL